MYETLLTNEECTHAIDMGKFYRVPCDKRGLNYDKYFRAGEVERNPLSEFDSNNTKLLNVEEVKENKEYMEQTRVDVKPSLWQRFKNSKFVRTIKYIMSIRVVLEVPALPEGKSEN